LLDQFKICLKQAVLLLNYCIYIYSVFNSWEKFEYIDIVMGRKLNLSFYWNREFDQVLILYFYGYS